MFVLTVKDCTGLKQLLSHCGRLLERNGTSEIVVVMQELMNTLLSLMHPKNPDSLMSIFTFKEMSTLLHLCKHPDRRVRRAGGKLLARLATLDEAKEQMMEEADTIPLLISMCKHSDQTSQLTGAKTLAELAEQPKNRVKLVRQGTLPAMFGMMRESDNEMQFQCARAMADLAEAVDNRVAIVYGGLDALITLMESQDDLVQEQAMRCLVNLCAPAGVVCGSDGAVGRFGALSAYQVADDDSDMSSSSSEDGSEVSP